MADSRESVDGTRWRRLRRFGLPSVIGIVVAPLLLLNPFDPAPVTAGATAAVTCSTSRSTVDVIAGGSISGALVVTTGGGEWSISVYTTPVTSCAGYSDSTYPIIEVSQSSSTSSSVSTIFRPGTDSGVTFVGSVPSPNTLDLTNETGFATLTVTMAGASGCPGNGEVTSTGGHPDFTDCFSGISNVVGATSVPTTFQLDPTLAATPEETPLFVGNDPAPAGAVVDLRNVSAGSQLGVALNANTASNLGIAHASVNGSVVTFARFYGVDQVLGSTSQATTFQPGTTSNVEFIGAGGLGNELDLSDAPSGAIVNIPTGTVSQPAGGSSDTFSGIQVFNGSTSGSTTFVAPPTDGVTFLGSGTGNDLDLSALPSGGSVVVDGNPSTNDGVVQGLSPGVGGLTTDTFSDIQSYTGPPGAPTGVSATGGNAQAMVSWLAPSSVGSSAITGYTVSASGGGGQSCATTTALTCTVTGLLNGTSYTFTVTASNSLGTGEVSFPSNSITPGVSVPPSLNAPPPTGVPSSAFGTPSSATTTPGATTTITLASSGATATVTVSGDAWPSDTLVSLYPLTNTAMIAPAITRGQSYVVAFAVSWQLPDGTSASSSKPVTLTISDPRILSSDTIYQVTSSGLNGVGTAAHVGVASVAPTNESTLVIVGTPVLTVASPFGRVVANGVAFTLRCSDAAPCRGAATLSMARRSTQGTKSVVSRATIADTAFSLAEGKTATVVLPMTELGKVLVSRQARRQGLPMTLLTTVTAQRKNAVIVIMD